MTENETNLITWRFNLIRLILNT